MMMSKISLYFLGTDEFAAVILERLVSDVHFEVLGVVVPPDRPVGRHQSLLPCSVKVMALNYGLPIHYEARDLLGADVDFLVVASYGVILGGEVLSIPRFASLNVHGSLLPRYRGAAPIQAALLNGDRVTGVCLQRMVSKLDAGPVYSFSEVAIREDHNATTLRAEMAYFAAEMVAQSLPGIRAGEIEALEQDLSAVSYSPKIDRASGRIDWHFNSAEYVVRMLKAYADWPGVFTFFNGKRLKLLGGAVCDGDGTSGLVAELDGVIGVYAHSGFFVLDRVQLEGRNDVSVTDFVRGHPDFIGAVLG